MARLLRQQRHLVGGDRVLHLPPQLRVALQVGEGMPPLLEGLPLTPRLPLGLRAPSSWTAPEGAPRPA